MLLREGELAEVDGAIGCIGKRSFRRRRGIGCDRPNSKGELTGLLGAVVVHNLQPRDCHIPGGLILVSEDKIGLGLVGRDRKRAILLLGNGHLDFVAVRQAIMFIVGVATLAARNFPHLVEHLTRISVVDTLCFRRHLRKLTGCIVIEVPICLGRIGRK